MPGFSPLDEELGLLSGALSPTVQEAVVRLGAMVPFGQVAAILAMSMKVGVSVATVRRLTLKSGAALVAVEDAAVEELERTMPEAVQGVPRQQVSVDGAMVPLQNGEWNEARTMVIGSLTAKHPGKVEALSYLSRLQSAETFTRTATGELHRRGTFGASLVAAVADGAVWCQSFVDYHLPNAVRVLDFTHAQQYLIQASQAVFGPGTAACSDWLGVQTQTLRHGDPQAVLAAVAALPVETAHDPKEATKTRSRVHAYLANRSSHITYADFVAQGLPIGSGVVESANKLLVEARLKGAGMHWDPINVNALLALRCAMFNQRWREAWEQSSRQRRLSATRSKPRVQPPPSPPAPSIAPVTCLAPLPLPKPRVKTIVNGKPTKDHPWRKPFLSPSTPAETAITKT